MHHASSFLFNLSIIQVGKPIKSYHVLSCYHAQYTCAKLSLAVICAPVSTTTTRINQSIVKFLESSGTVNTPATC